MVTRQDKRLALGRLGSLVEQIEALVSKERQVIVVRTASLHTPMQMAMPVAVLDVVRTTLAIVIGNRVGLSMQSSALPCKHEPCMLSTTLSCCHANIGM